MNIFNLGSPASPAPLPTVALTGADFIQPFVGYAVWVFQAFFKRSIEGTMSGGVGRHHGVVVGLRRGWCVIGKVISGHVLVGGKEERWMDVEMQVYKVSDLKVSDKIKKFH